MRDKRNDTGARSAPRTSDDHAFAVMNTVRALEVIASGPRSVPELAAELQIGERSARRLLKRLAAEGYVRQGGGLHRRYRATLWMAAIGRRLLDHAPLPQVALPHLERLAEATWSRAQLWIAGPDKPLCILEVDGDLRRPAPHPVFGHLYDGDVSAVERVLQSRPPRPEPIDLAAAVHDANGVSAAVAIVVEEPVCAPDDVLARHVQAAAAALSAALQERIAAA